MSSETLPLQTTVTSSADEPSISITELFEMLETRHPTLKKKRILTSVAVAVNLEYADMDDGQIKAGDEVAIIPPVSGG
jgi:molybdopterin converting factor small subunit